MNTPAALDYATQTRGWRLDTVHAARLGFMPRNRRRLLDGLTLPARWRETVEHFPADMLVYPHFEAGRLTYLSGRSVEGKRHYNPPREVLGERQPYFNRCYQANSPQVVVVEGQADAVTLGQWQDSGGGAGRDDRVGALLARLKAASARVCPAG